MVLPRSSTIWRILATFLIFLITTSLALPAANFKIILLDHDTLEQPPPPQPITVAGPPTALPAITAHQHTKRHDWTLICRSLIDPNDLSKGKQDDNALTKRCALKNKYTCDRTGEPDIMPGGKTDRECDQKCECKDRGANPKPMCMGILGAGSQSGWGICSGL